MSLRIYVTAFCLLATTGVVAQERIDLESTFVGDREQPSVSYIIPWNELSLEGTAGGE